MIPTDLSYRLIYYNIFFNVLFVTTSLHAQTDIQNELLPKRSQWIRSAISFDSATTAYRSAAHYFYHAFSIPSDIEVQKATIHVAGIGLHDVSINGQAVTEDKLQPASSAYDNMVLYSSYRVDSLLHLGDNALGVVIGNGKYNLQKNGFRQYGLPRLWLQLHIHDQNDSVTVVGSSLDWLMTADGPIRQNNEYHGEVTDYSKHIHNWAKADMDVSSDIWQNVSLDTSWHPVLIQKKIPAQRINRIFEAKEISRVNDTLCLIDAGENISGWLQIHIPEKSSGYIKVRYAELLDTIGQLDTRSIRGATSQNTYYLDEQHAIKILQPSFCYHGFRYATIEAPKHLIDSIQINVCHVYNNLVQTGQFVSSDTTLNQLFEISKRTIQNNYHDMPTDCPQRDERFGWLGDRVGTIRGEAYLHDIQALYNKWIQDIQLEQKETGALPNLAPAFWEVYRDNVTWPMGYIEFIHVLYKRYGDIDLVRSHFQSMDRWINHICSLRGDDLLIHIDQYSDWSIPTFDGDVNPSLLSSSTILSSCSFIQALRSLIFLSEVTNQTEKAQAYRKHIHEIQQQIQHTFLTNTIIKNDPYSPTELLLFIRHIDLKKQIKKKLADQLYQKLTVEFDTTMVMGIVGNRALFTTLTQLGFVDLAYQLATQMNYPSLGFMLENGATTVWETWHRDPKKSQNHAMLIGDLQEWLFKHVAGIDQAPNATAFELIQLKPYIPRSLDSIKSVYHSPRGPITSQWINKNGAFTWRIIIPEGANTDIYLPCKQPSSHQKSAHFTRTCKENGVNYAVFSVPAGSYKFSSTIQHSPKTKIDLQKNKKTVLTLPCDTTLNGWLFKYYPIRTERLISLDSLTPQTIGQVFELNSDRIKHRPNFWAMKYQATLHIPKNGRYFFYLQSDDGAELRIDDQSIIRNDGIHYKTMQSGQIRLKKGTYSIEIDHFNWWSFNTLRLFFSSKNYHRQPIPNKWLTVPKSQ